MELLALSNTLSSLKILNPVSRFSTLKLPKFMTALTANFTQLPALAKLLPQLFFLKLAVKSLNHCLNSLLMPDFIRKIDRAVNPYILKVIWLALSSSCCLAFGFCCSAIRQFYEWKRSEGKNHLNAMGHVCHKMLSIIFAVLRDNKPYVPA